MTATFMRQDPEKRLLRAGRDPRRPEQSWGCFAPFAMIGEAFEGRTHDPGDQLPVGHPGELAEDREIRMVGAQTRQGVDLHEVREPVRIGAQVDPSSVTAAETAPG